MRTADAGTHEAPHGMSDGAAHTADLAIAALVDHEAEDAWREHADLGGCGEPVLEFHALAQ